MRFKDILTVVTSQVENEHVFALAEQLADQNSGRISSLVVTWMPTVVPVDAWGVDPLFSQLVELAKKQLKEETNKVKARLSGTNDAVPVEGALIEVGYARSAIGLRARHADVTVVSRPSNKGSDLDHALLEGPLFESGRPTLVVPPDWKRRRIGRSVMVCWKPTREAARALADAEDFVTCADQVTVVTVDAKPSQDGYGPSPGADITAHLARRGAKVELMNLASSGRSESKAILDQALAVGADLLVMGGYGRSRMSEFLFGGVTRDILKSATVPVLMSH